MDNLLSIILSATAIATFLNILLKRFNIPTIIGYIITGFAIAYLYNLGKNNESLNHIAEFGIVFLMFTVGLEFSIKHLLGMKRDVFFNGFMQVALVGGIISLSAEYIFDIEQKSAIIIGYALALSSTAIVLKILNDSGNIHTVYGRKALGILLFQDIAVIPILLMINIFTVQNSSISDLLWQTLYSVIIVLALLWVVGKYLLNRFLSLVVWADTEEIFIASVLMLVVSASFLAHSFGFSYSLGAFLAGMMMAETQYKHQIEADLVPFRDILLGLFFMTVGMQIDLNIIVEHYMAILLIGLAVICLKIAVVYLIIVFQVGSRISLKAALTICQGGEFSLAILALASSSNLLDQTISQVLIIIVVISMITTPFILKNIKHIVNMVTKEPENGDFIINSSGIKDHIIVCGYGKLGQEIVYRLKKLNINYIVIEHDITLVKLGQSRDEPVYFGNVTEKTILKNAFIENCRAVIIAINNEKKLILLCEILQSFDKPIKVVAKASDYDEKKLLQALHVDYIINEGREAAKALLKVALNEPTPE
ncbi:MAG: cation:proton antiporter [Sulfurospirillaceae bacterium]|nr:cation:proton antiporter [Sulfurospirillaceae bacterium]